MSHKIDLQLMHDWYRLGCLLDALASSITGTWFMDDLAYVYEYLDCGSSCWGLVHG
jgi:hypothetical protein